MLVEKKFGTISLDNINIYVYICLFYIYVISVTRFKYYYTMYSHEYIDTFKKIIYTYINTGKTVGRRLQDSQATNGKYTYMCVTLRFEPPQL